MAKAQGRLTIRRRPNDGEPGKDGQDAWTIVVTPPVILATDGKIPTWSYVKVELYVGGEKVRYDSLGPLLPGKQQGQDAETGLYWSWETSYGGTMAFRLRATALVKDFTAESYLTYNGKTYPFSIPFQIVRNGTAGAAGKDIHIPPPRLWEEYPTGYRFRNGSEVGDDGIYRADLVLYRSGDDYLGALCRVCHTKSSDHNPATDNTDKKTEAQNPYWRCQDGRYRFVATDLLLAVNGVIKLLTSNKVCIYNDDGTVNAAFAGGEWPAWFGGLDPEVAPTKISSDGTIYSRRAVLEGDVIFAGKVLPMETTITSANYRNYRMETGNYEGISDYCLDFSRLTGRVIIDKTFQNVSDTECAKIFWLWGAWGGNGYYPDLWKYIGSSLLVRNEMQTANIFIDGFGYLSKDPDLASDYVSRLILTPGQEVLLECRLRLVSGGRRIGWWISYHGSG